jgi:hypothetical protein
VRFFDERSPHVDRFGALLTLTGATIVTLSLTGLARLGEGRAGLLGTAVTTVIVGATLLLALRASGVARGWRRAADVLVGLMVAVALLGVVVGGVVGVDVEVTLGPEIWAVLSLFAPVVVVRRLLRHHDVTTRTLQGAISAYLLIPVAFMYFSLATITTVGYGDLAPASDVGRLLAALEALLGQVFLVTFVALLVGLLAERWRVNRSPAGPGE